MPLKTVQVPEPYEALFKTAEDYVQEYFQSFQLQPENGSIVIGGERYILVRAASMSSHLFDHIKRMYPALSKHEAVEAAAQVLFDIAKTIGKHDAKAFHDATHVTDPVAKLATGPVHFAYSGWAFVDISPLSVPSPDDSFYLLYDHPHSFEADAWLSQGKKTDYCTCFMNAGYSSGWCQQSFGITLTAQEIFCRARGDESCRFIMSPPEKLQAYIDRYFNEQRSA